MLVPQVAFAEDHTIMAISVLSLLETLSTAISLAIGKSIFHNRLVDNLHTIAPSADASLITGNSALVRDIVPDDLLPSVLNAYSRSIMQTFYAGVAMCALSLFGSASLPWKSIKEEESPDSTTGDDNSAHSADENRPEMTIFSIEFEIKDQERRKTAAGNGITLQRTVRTAEMYKC
ncbi:uncharacterized protein BDW47DRAFT_128387 [Aspergillus candidus]|uniref:Uncharacterized protein n=1 Tax=Aspergillus candidus TaxID=41067 RepID=A0A2I2F3L9_ASPCN|nr:hypothetical protein BDW47DRAFT_128387 [Aspergillus candidus]PLB35188.1 hypothetical protein BDW47DRAFT_128387 [Aspergillus candidus]